MSNPSHSPAHQPVLDVTGDAIRNLGRWPLSSQGALILEFTSTIDGDLLAVSGAAGSLSLEIVGGRLDGRVSHDGRVAQLDAEDALGMDDGRPHTVALVVDDAGTHLFSDGYEIFSSTSTAWFEQIEASELNVDPAGIMSPHRLRVWTEPLSAHEVVANSPAVQPWLQFAASELSARDARRCSLLNAGALRARVRLRGMGQGGTVMEARGDAGSLRIGIEGGDITYTVCHLGETVADVRAEGQWDDGDWHDIVVVSGRGAVDIYADGYQVAHNPGEAFFEELGSVDRVVVGAGVNGSRLFGEAQAAMIYDQVLSDHQVKRLAGAEPLRTQALFDAGFLGSRSYRIPSLLRLDSGVLLAGADQRVSIANDSPNDINFVLRRSFDDGRTWEDPQILIEYPGSGRLGASVIDSILLQDSASGRVFVLIDHFPGGMGQPNCELGTGHSASGRLLLIDRDEAAYELNSDGSVCTADGDPSDYHVDPQGNVTKNGQPAGNIYLAEGVDERESLLTVRTVFFQMIYSDDDGETWSTPIDLTSQLKEDWMRFFGTSPGNGIQLKHGPHAGRLLAPIYYNHEEGITFSCAAIYSDDGGATWHRGQSPNDGRLLDGNTIDSRTLTDDRGSLHESTLVEGKDGAVHVFMRNQHPSGRVGHAISHDGGESWGEVDYVDQLTEIFSQPNAINVVDGEGRNAILFANASQMLPFRGCGVLRLSYDDGAKWPHNRVFNPGHYVYQCMTQLTPDTVGLLWEREWQGLFFTEVPLTWLTASRSTVS